MATIGVKIELEGAPQYKENMSNLTAQTKLYEAQVKRLSAEMDKSASAFTKSIAESKALNQQLEAQKNQSKLLEQQIAKTSEKYGEDSTQVIKLKTQYEKLQMAIANTEKQLEANGGLFGAISKQIEETSKKIGDLGDKISSVGDSLTKNVTAPITAIGVASVASWKEVDAGLDTIIAKTGATGEALENMQQSARNIATTIPASFEEAGNAIGEVNTRFGLTGEELEKLSTKFIEFAQLNGTDVSGSIDKVQAAMAAFGLDASEAGGVLDILNKAGQDTGISMDSLSSALLSNASSLTEMGFSINQASGLIANLEKNGVDSSSAMAGLKKAFTNAAKEGKTMDQALKELDDAMKSGDSTTAAYQAAMELFGNKAGPQLAKAISEGRLSLDAAANAVENYGDSVSNTFESTQDPLDQFTVNMNKMKLLGEDIVNTSAPLITSAMEKLSEVIQRISDAWAGLSEDEQEQIIKIALVVAAIGPAISILGKVIKTVSNVGTAISSVVSFLPGLITAITSIGSIIVGTVIPAIVSVVAAIAPFLAIAAVVVAAITGIILIIQNWGAITDWIQEKWLIVSEFLDELLTNMQDFFESHFGIIGQIISAKIEMFKTVIKTGFTIIQTIIQAVMDVIKAITEGDWQKVGEIIANAWVTIQNTINQAKAKVLQIIVNLLNSIKEKFSNIAKQALTWGKDMIQNFIDGIKAKFNAVKQAVTDIANAVKNILGFSVPKEGPLADADTYGPDFMKLYAEGIENAKYLVQDAALDVAMDVNSVIGASLSADELYDAVRRGASDATLSLAIGDREFSRELRNMGVVFDA